MAEQVLDRDEWMRRTGPLYPVLVAAWMATRAPMPRGFQPTADDLGRAAPWFPLVGGLLGAAVALVGAILLRAGLVPALVAAVLVALVVLGTGALREIAATRTAERLRGDEDESTAGIGPGIYGGMALAALVGLRGLGLVAIDTDRWVGALIVSQGVACWVPLMLLKLGDRLEAPLPRRRSLLVGDFSWTVFAVASGATALGGLIFGGGAGFLAVILAAGAAFGLGLLLQRRFGGLSAEGLAAAAAVCELLVFLCFAAAAPASASPWVR